MSASSEHPPFWLSIFCFRSNDKFWIPDWKLFISLSIFSRLPKVLMISMTLPAPQAHEVSWGDRDLKGTFLSCIQRAIQFFMYL